MSESKKAYFLLNILQMKRQEALLNNKHDQPRTPPSWMWKTLMRMSREIKETQVAHSNAENKTSENPRKGLFIFLKKGGGMTLIKI